MKNSIQYFTEKGIPELEKIKINFMESYNSAPSHS